ncbi:kinesin-domain-containing protein [Artomyces pyxidatus]|uniref:Kinesin-domain-containing protein n=1 Tax=Artomyces pyxidatus TaxID=48021 RepID=A0ACB8THT6_9AGAM|nr:kinesin-domain-containing protein [Artomyces pyxidatus]
MATRARGATHATRASTRTTRGTTQDAPAPVATTRNTRTATKAAPTAHAPTSQPSTTRKPLINRDNSVEPKAPVNKKIATLTKPTKLAKQATVAIDNDREPIKAFLRIRPDLNGDRPTTMPYLERLSDTSVRMVDPSHENSGQNTFSRFRPSIASPSAIYTFSHIFPSDSQQSEFFTKTTLPLVKGLLDGENGLLFAYGVTNSGKTYTMQGGSHKGSAGILPRTLDVLFNSIEGLQSQSRYRPVRLQGIELDDASNSSLRRGPSLDNLSTEEPVLAEVLAEHLDAASSADTDIDPTVLIVDRNHEYSIWLSYAEVYNEKIYDLLAGGETEGAGASRSQPILLSRKALPIRPSPPSDSPDSEGSTGKYISGLTQVRVDSANAAKNLVKLGQLHRRVFGTLANSQSSRSHGIVTIKLLRKHRGEKDEPSSYHTARLTLIDLAGSERTKHTQTTGERLKEAGSINKSLMVLGQCMEVMRANQKRVAQSLAGPRNERSDTRDVKKTLAMVPFRHSKLTEILMDYFVGDGRAIMIVNVNPYDTGFDENSHVMKFSALAKEVSTPAPSQRPFAPPPGPSRLGIAQATRPSEVHRRKVIISTDGQGGRKYSETQVEVMEVDEDPADEEEEDDDEPLNPLVEALFDELEDLRAQLIDAEMRSAIVEAETREEVMREMEERMHEMEKMFARRLMNEVEQNEMKMDAKIDMLHQSGLFGKTPGKAKRVLEDLDEEDDVERSILESNDDSSDDENGMHSIRSGSLSPLAAKSKRVKGQSALSAVTEIRAPIAAAPSESSIPSGSSDGDMRRLSEGANDGDDEDEGTEADVADEEIEEYDETEMEAEEEDDISEETESDGDWVPGAGQASKPKSVSPERKAATPAYLTEAPSPIFEEDVKAGRVKGSIRAPVIAKPLNPILTEAPSPIFDEDVKARLAKGSARKSGKKLSELAADLGGLTLSDEAGKPPAANTKGKAKTSSRKASSKMDDAPDTPEVWDQLGDEDSVIIVPKTKGHADGMKKKKRQLGSQSVVTEEQIQRATIAADRITQSDSGKSIRRMARGSK